MFVNHMKGEIVLKRPIEGPDTVQILNICTVVSNKSIFDKLPSEGQKGILLRLATYEKKYGPFADIIEQLKKQGIVR